MGMWTAITVICIAAIFGEAYRKKHQGSAGKETLEKLDDLAGKIDRVDRELRDRVETLERIVTDRKENLKRKFDHLDKAS